MDITIGIVTWNSKNLLKRCLDTLRANTQHIRYRTLVVDNDSKDGSLNMVQTEYPWVEIYSNCRNLGVARARNIILRRATGDYTVLLDVDTEILPGAIEQLVHEMERDKQVAIAGPKLLNPDGSLQLSCRTFQTPMTILFRGTSLRHWFPSSRFVSEHLMSQWAHDECRYVDWVIGACHTIRQQALKEIGLLDEGYFYLYEDVDYCLRAKKLGWKVLYAPSSQLIHVYERKSAKSFNKMTIKHLCSISRYLWKRYMRKELVIKINPAEEIRQSIEKFL